MDNYARLVFLAPGAPSFFTQWPELARCMVAALRAQTGSGAGSARLTRLVGELAAGSEGHRIWAFHPADDATSNALRRLVGKLFGTPWRQGRCQCSVP